MSVISISESNPRYEPPLFFFPFFFPRTTCSRGAGAGAPISANSGRAWSAWALALSTVSLMISFGASDINLSFVVKEADADRTLRLLYRELLAPSLAEGSA